MKKKDTIDELFSRLQGKLDLHHPSNDHKARFLKKLRQQPEVIHINALKKSRYKRIAIAASIAVLCTITAISFSLNPSPKADLASVSEQMQETQSFFTSAIEVQLEEIDNISSMATKELVIDAMKQLRKLEADYDMLTKDLVHSGNDKRVISAMVKNFQKRANLLEQVLQKMNDINELKYKQNENSIL
ncbi:hypothetical protein J8281_07305 [Aquimarina sp. U1-2]|uniref:hypothetical protein n=1 Tax=Aquimarina sp. U1-2 TaxID=2823141 RepID=UPI001AECE99B|nr:hypothetical protein [Aquimarina sp. U1-2]MBP2831994.1 hypothetical protein [Aquimarina sp. U1-2]